MISVAYIRSDNKDDIDWQINEFLLRGVDRNNIFIDEILHNKEFIRLKKFIKENRVDKCYLKEYRTISDDVEIVILETHPLENMNIKLVFLSKMDEEINNIPPTFQYLILSSYFINPNLYHHRSQ